MRLPSYLKIVRYVLLKLSKSSVLEELFGYVRAAAQKIKNRYISAKVVLKVIIQKVMFMFTRRTKKSLKNIKELFDKERYKTEKISLR